MTLFQITMLASDSDWALLEQHEQVFGKPSASIHCERRHHWLVFNYPTTKSMPSLSDTDSNISGRSGNTVNAEQISRCRRNLFQQQVFPSVMERCHAFLFSLSRSYPIHSTRWQWHESAFGQVRQKILGEFFKQFCWSERFSAVAIRNLL